MLREESDAVLHLIEKVTHNITKYRNLIVDGPYLAYRSYNIPYRFITSTGLDATMINGFMKTLNFLRKKFDTQHTVIAWESKGTNLWRKRIYPSYKKKSNGRTKKYWSSIKSLQTLLYLLGVEQYFSPENEADDVIGRLVKNKYNKNTIIFSGDKDLMQVVSESCHVYDGRTVYTPTEVKTRYQVMPYQIPDLLAITGDRSDNISGINGYGIFKTSRILEKYNTIENIDETDTLHKYMTKMKFNKKLTTLNYDCPLRPVPNTSFKTTETVESILDMYELTQIKENINEYKLLGSKGEIDEWL